MLKEFVGVGATVEEATRAAKAGLNAPEFADVKIEVVTLPKKKILGLFGGSDAKVRAYYDVPEKKKKAQKPRAERPEGRRKAQKPQADKQSGGVKTAVTEPQEIKAEKAARPQKGHKNEKPAEKAPRAEKAEKAEKTKAQPQIRAEEIDVRVATDYLKGILDHMGCRNAGFVTSVEDGAIQIEIVCDDYGIIIGRRGETLDAIQHLTSLAVKKHYDKYIRVTINVGSYREKRAETIRALAKKQAAKVLANGRRYTFEPMNPYERRIIHTAVQEIEGVESRSIGVNEDRRVVLEPTGGVRYNRDRDRSRSRRGGRSRSQASAPQSDAPHKADRADLPFGKIEVKPAAPAESAPAEPAQSDAP
ncbi:MAG: KH domain-containing protein [Clostridiales bacterium]|nr:KH domain-containing protein [Clostridiales bacterium]